MGIKRKPPGRGSRSFWHRRRASRIVPRIRSWGDHGKGLEAFGGIKAGMIHVVMVEDSEAPTKGQEVAKAATVVVTPPLFVYSVIAFKKTIEGLKPFAEVPATIGIPKEAKRVLTPAKKAKHSIDDLKKQVSEIADVRIIALSLSSKSGISKNPFVIEMAVGGANAAEKLDFAASVLGKEVSVSDVFNEGDVVDTIAVTKGKGWQGVVKRYGVALNIRKATQKRRHGGSLGAERQAKVMYTIPRAGQMGFHRRTDWNKRIMAVSKDSGKFTPAGGFKRFGIPKTDFVLIEGSIPGPSKRFVLLRKSLRNKKSAKPEIKKIVK
ncbi:MAG: 50S ribosomal protein L3 [Candidatus Micrarchaeota archaeon]